MRSQVLYRAAQGSHTTLPPHYLATTLPCILITLQPDYLTQHYLALKPTCTQTNVHTHCLANSLLRAPLQSDQIAANAANVSRSMCCLLCCHSSSNSAHTKRNSKPETEVCMQNSQASSCSSTITGTTSNGKAASLRLTPAAIAAATAA
jgi:hypothetical protein